MIEFGVKLKQIREEKGMTQQTLADHLYVTRQAVSKWECGDRYPDLLTAKKLAVFLNVKLDELLSDEEMTNAVEKNSVIEKAFVKNILIALYAGISFSFMITIMNLVLELTSDNGVMNASEIQYMIINVIAFGIQIIAFLYGFGLSVMDRLTPKKTGVITLLFFVTTVLASIYDYIFVVTDMRMLCINIIMNVVPGVLGCIAAYKVFMCKKQSMMWLYLLFVVSAYGIFRSIYSTYMMIHYTADFGTGNIAVNALLTIGIYILIIYQGYVIVKKENY